MIKIFYLDRETELTNDLLQKMINKFILNKQPLLQKWKNYYDGKHAILDKSYADKNKECNHIVTNYCKIITDTYSGYIVGKPVSYSANENIEDVQEIINYNDSQAEDMTWCTNALIYGVGYELQWLDKYSQVRYSQINPLNAFAIYDNTLECELLYFVRWYDADSIDNSDLVYIEVYSTDKKVIYKSNGILGRLTFVEEKENHFKDVPVSVFYLNDNRENIFNQIISLNDAYNELQSSEIDDFNAWVDAYLTLSGADADSDDIADMKKDRVLILPEGAKAEWLTKNTNDTQIVNLLNNIKENIFKITACPDMADKTFLAQSGTALAYKLVGFENVASGIVTNFKRAIQRRIELICNILNLKASEAVWRDINISFVRNLPSNVTETIQLVNSLKGIVSDKTLLTQIAFIDDVERELEAIQKQKQDNMAIYNFGTHEHNDSEESDT
ncbi:MAG: phage portal protein [Bacilli bacterium]|nr:phage portal protein [Bacilli bacterium]